MPSKNPYGRTSAPNELRMLPIVGFADAMVLARESVMYAALLLEGMVDQTLATCPVPGAREVRLLGLRPISDPEACDLPIYHETHGKARATIFSHQNVVYTYSEGSAASTTDETGDNDFIEMLIDLLREYRPRILYVATFSRLVRSALFSGKLLQALQRYCPRVNVGGMEIDVTTTNGQMTWQTLSLVASIERDFIVQRLFAGMVSKYRRGEWVPGRRAVPYGYELSQKRLVPAPDLKPKVEKMLEILADDDRSVHQRIRALGDLGLRSFHHRHQGRVDHLRDPGRKLRQMYRWSSLHATGSHTVVLANPFPGARQFSDLPVHYDEGDMRGRIHLPYEIGVPDGGWASDDVLARVRAAARRSALPSERSAAETDRHWFTAFVNHTSSNGHHLVLLPSHRSYALRQTPMVDKK